MRRPSAIKKLLSIAATVGCVACLFSCEGKGPEPPPAPHPQPPPDEEEPFPVGSWHTTHQYFSREVDEDAPDDIEEKWNLEVYGAVVDAESYKLSFYEDGSGSGSAFDRENEWRFDFLFTWKLSDEWLSISEVDTGVGYGVFLTHLGATLERVNWEVESSSADRMVLSWHEILMAEWQETHTHRYTFEKDDEKDNTP